MAANPDEKVPEISEETSRLAILDLDWTKVLLYIHTEKQCLVSVMPKINLLCHGIDILTCNIGLTALPRRLWIAFYRKSLQGPQTETLRLMPPFQSFLLCGLHQPET